MQSTQDFMRTFEEDEGLKTFLGTKTDAKKGKTFHTNPLTGEQICIDREEFLMNTAKSPF